MTKDPKPLTAALVPLIVLGLFCLFSLFCFLLNAHEFFISYLFAMIFWLGLPIAGLFFQMTHFLTGGDWGLRLRTPLNVTMKLMPVLAFVSLPLLFGLESLRVGTGGNVGSPNNLFREVYFNPWWIKARFLIYFGVWLFFSFVLRKMVKTEANDRSAQKVSSLGLILLILTLSFAGIDWIMFFDDGWYSQIFGLLFGASLILTGYAACLCILPQVYPQRGEEEISLKTKRDIGNLLLACLMVWAYFSVSQLIIIWTGNTEKLTLWYVHRSSGGWFLITLAIVVFNFFIPFVLLLQRSIKHNLRRLAALAYLLLAFHFIELAWLLLPSFHQKIGEITWQNIAMPFAMGIVVLSFLRRYLMEASRDNLERRPSFQ